MQNHTYVDLIGNLTADPDVKDVDESKVANFKVAVNRKWRNRDGELQGKVDFISVVAWNNLAENVQKYCKKGDPVFVAGRLDEDRWEKDGQKRTKLQIIADKVTFLSRPPKTEEADDDSFK